MFTTQEKLDYFKAKGLNPNEWDIDDSDTLVKRVKESPPTVELAPTVKRTPNVRVRTLMESLAEAPDASDFSATLNMPQAEQGLTDSAIPFTMEGLAAVPPAQAAYASIPYFSKLPIPHPLLKGAATILGPLVVGMGTRMVQDKAMGAISPKYTKVMEQNRAEHPTATTAGSIVGSLGGSGLQFPTAGNVKALAQAAKQAVTPGVTMSEAGKAALGNATFNVALPVGQRAVTGISDAAGAASAEGRLPTIKEVGSKIMPQTKSETAAELIGALVGAASTPRGKSFGRVIPDSPFSPENARDARLRDNSVALKDRIVADAKTRKVAEVSNPENTSIADAALKSAQAEAKRVEDFNKARAELVAEQQRKEMLNEIERRQQLEIASAKAAQAAEALKLANDAKALALKSTPTIKSKQAIANPVIENIDLRQLQAGMKAGQIKPSEPVVSIRPQDIDAAPANELDMIIREQSRPTFNIEEFGNDLAMRREEARLAGESEPRYSTKGQDAILKTKATAPTVAEKPKLSIEEAASKGLVPFSPKLVEAVQKLGKWRDVVLNVDRDQFENSHGTPIMGKFVIKDGIKHAFVNPDNATTDVLFHELFHPFWQGLKKSTSKTDQAFVKRVEPKLQAVVDRINAEKGTSYDVEELIAQASGETIAKQLKAKDASFFKEMLSAMKVWFNKGDINDIMNVMSAKMRYDAPASETTPGNRGGIIVPINTTERQSTKETAKDVGNPAVAEQLKYSVVKEPVYHATDVLFDRADPAKAREESQYTSAMGMHFGSAKQAADRSKTQHTFNIKPQALEGSTVAKITERALENSYPQTQRYRLDIRKPLRVTDGEANRPRDLAEKLIREQQKNLSDAEIKKLESIASANSGNDLAYSQDVVDIVKKLGYDGLVYINTEEGGDFADSYVAFDKKQIVNDISPKQAPTGEWYSTKETAKDLSLGNNKPALADEIGQPPPSTLGRKTYDFLRTASELDKMRAKSKHHDKLGRALQDAFAEKDEIKGKFWGYEGSYRDILSKMSLNERIEWQKLRLQGKKEQRDVTKEMEALSPEAVKAYELSKISHVQAANEQRADGQPVYDIDGNPRERGITEYYASESLSSAGKQMFSYDRNSPEFTDFKQDLIDYWANVIQDKDSSVSIRDANAMASKLFDDFETQHSASGSKQPKFGPVRRPEGLGLPLKWTELDPLVADANYWERFSKDRAWFKHIESKPDLAMMLGKKLDPWGNPLKTDVKVPYLGNDVTVQRVTDAMINTPDNLSAGKAAFEGTSRFINAVLTGLSTSVNNLPAVVVNSSALVKPTQVVPMLATLKNIKTSKKTALKNGLAQKDYTQIEEVLNASSRFIDKANEATRLYSKWTGRSWWETWSRAASQGFGEFIAASWKQQAAAGDKTAARWLDNIVGNQDWESMPIDKLGSRIAANYIENKYNIESLPQVMVNSDVSPLFKLMRWSVAQQRNFNRIAIEPAIKDGNIKPLLTMLLGAAGAGAVVEEVRKLARGGNKGPTPTLKEIATADKQKLTSKVSDDYAYYVFANVVAAGSVGYQADMVKTLVDGMREQLSSGGLQSPTVEFVSSTGEHIKNFAAAIAEDKSPLNIAKSFQELTLSYLADNVQNARILLNAYAAANPESEAGRELTRKEQARDLRVFNRLSDAPIAPSIDARANMAKNKKERKFKSTDLLDINNNKGKFIDTYKLLTELADEYATKYGRNPRTTIDKFEELSVYPSKGFPSIQDRQKFAEFVNWYVAANSSNEEEARKIQASMLTTWANEQANNELRKAMVDKVKELELLPRLSSRP